MTSENGRIHLSLTVQRDLPVIPAIVRAIVGDGGDVWSSTPIELTLDEMFSIVVEKSRVEREKVSA